MIVYQQLNMMRLAENAAKKSTCAEQVGAAIVLRSGLIYTAHNLPRKNRLDLHAEDALLKLLKTKKADLTGAILFVTRRPCVVCTELLTKYQLSAIYYRDHQPEMGHLLKFSDRGTHLDGMWATGALIRRNWWVKRSGGATLPPTTQNRFKRKPAQRSKHE